MTSLKCLVVGDGAVGKTTLLITYTTGSYPSEYVPIVFDNYEVHAYHRGEEVSLRLWDKAASDDDERLTALWYRDTDVLLLCFSVVSPSSFANVRSRWWPEVLHFCEKAPPMVLVGTKADLRTDEGTASRLREKGLSAVSGEEAEALAKEIGAVMYVETSSLRQLGVSHVAGIRQPTADSMQC